MPETPRRIFFDAVLRPHRSLPPQGFLIVMLILCAISFAAGIVFTLMGAWPVLGFFGLDIALVYWAFRVNYRAAQTIETVTLTDASLDVARHQPGQPARTWTFEPTWVRVLFNGVEARRPRLELHTRDKALQIGAFLAPHEREDLAKALEKALAERRSALPHL